MPVTLRQLRYFQALVEHGSFSRAAESVHISQPALSLQIRELEASLGGPVVERESRGIQLTRLGREAHEQTLRILDETLLLETMGKRFEEGPLRFAVGILPTLAPYLLASLLDRLKVSAPRVGSLFSSLGARGFFPHCVRGGLAGMVGERGKGRCCGAGPGL